MSGEGREMSGRTARRERVARTFADRLRKVADGIHQILDAGKRLPESGVLRCLQKLLRLQNILDLRVLELFRGVA